MTEAKIKSQKEQTALHEELDSIFNSLTSLNSHVSRLKRLEDRLDGSGEPEAEAPGQDPEPGSILGRISTANGKLRRDLDALEGVVSKLEEII